MHFISCHHWRKESEPKDGCEHLFILAIIFVVLVIFVILVLIFVVLVIFVIILVFVILIVVIIVIAVVIIIIGVDLSRQHVLDPLLQLVCCGHVVTVIHFHPDTVSILNVYHANLRGAEVNAESLLPIGHQQREVVWVDPDDAEVGVICVLTGHLLQDFQELKTVWVILLSKGNNVLSINVILPDLVHAVRLKFSQGWPVVLLNVVYNFSLSVGLSWNGVRLFHERLVEVNFIQPELQFLGDLSVEGGIELDEGMELLSSIVILDEVG